MTQERKRVLRVQPDHDDILIQRLTSEQLPKKCDRHYKFLYAFVFRIPHDCPHVAFR
jgi:hypothetical protein